MLNIVNNKIFIIYSGLIVLFLSFIFISFHSNASNHEEDNENQMDDSENSVAYFAGGCFWCSESDYEAIEGVVDVISGYEGGTVDRPTYKQVTTGRTGAREAIKVIYDPNIVSYSRLVEILWYTTDPFNDRGQFCDGGFQYTAAIYYQNDEEERIALESKRDVEDFLGEETVTAIESFEKFYPAEDYHQNYYKENPIRYNYYRSRCGRDARVKAVWKDRAIIPDKK